MVKSATDRETEIQKDGQTELQGSYTSNKRLSVGLGRSHRQGFVAEQIWLGCGPGYKYKTATA